MKIEDEREKQKMTKENKQQSKDWKEQGETEAILKGWELNDFVLLLS